MAAGIFEVWVFGHPVEEVVFWEHGKRGALGGNGADVADGFLVVGFEAHGLWRGVSAQQCDDGKMHVQRVFIPLGAFVLRLPCGLVPCWKMVYLGDAVV